ncbi:DJ-1 family glyoxalase III [Prevotella sp.]|uniref:DJ-1 family glyoxalase III n=1 Tax=Prevotella sp. TaxID=59823 RepID=UPI002674E559
MAKVYEFLATGFEEVEALLPLDIMRRAGVEFKTVSVTGAKEVESSHGVKITADLLFEEADFSDADLLMIPGGLPGATNLNEHAGVKKALIEQNRKGKMIGAICAGPMVLGGLGLLSGKRATCYPGFEKYLDEAEYTHELCTVDGNITTGEGPAATLPYSYTLLEALTDHKTADSVAEGMMYKHLMMK